MRNSLLHLIVVLVLMGPNSISNGQNIIGAEISFEELSSSYFRFHVTTYTINEPDYSISLGFGDGSVAIIELASYAPDSIYVNTGYADHVFSMNGCWRINVEGSNLIPGILNVENSENEYLHFHIMVCMNDPVAFGLNSSPVNLNPIIGYSVSENCTITNQPNVYDADGDSLYFELIPFPAFESTIPYASDLITINEHTAEFIWASPIMKGLFGVAYQATEFRNGVLIGYTMNCIVMKADCSIDPPPLEIYPSPANSILTIKTNHPVDRVEIFDVVGQLIGRYEVDGYSTLHIDVTMLAEGTYIVRALGTSTDISKCFVKI